MDKYSFNLSFMVGYSDDNDTIGAEDFCFEDMPCEVEANSYEEAKDKALVRGHEIIRFLDKLGVIAYLRVEKN
jgi:hypothetical protein